LQTRMDSPKILLNAGSNDTFVVMDHGNPVVDLRSGSIYPSMGITLHLAEYDPSWPARFAAESERLRGAIGSHAVAIEHVGSTAVPGQAGKAVLDVGIAVEDERAAEACVEPLRGLGYESRGPHGDDPRRRYFVRDEGGRRVAHIHLYILPAPAWSEKLAFRDALRADPTLAIAYEAEKRRVADAVGWDKAAYALAKGPFIQATLHRIQGNA